MIAHPSEYLLVTAFSLKCVSLRSRPINQSINCLFVFFGLFQLTSKKCSPATDKLPNGAYMAFAEHSLDEYGWSNLASIKWLVSNYHAEARFTGKSARSHQPVSASMISPIFSPPPRFHTSRSSRFYQSCKVGNHLGKLESFFTFWTFVAKKIGIFGICYKVFFLNFFLLDDKFFTVYSLNCVCVCLCVEYSAYAYGKCWKVTFFGQGGSRIETTEHKSESINSVAWEVGVDKIWYWFHLLLFSGHFLRGKLFIRKTFAKYLRF